MALAAAKARGVILGDYARISAAKRRATTKRAEAVRGAIESTMRLSTAAAAADLNARNITTVAGGRWHPMTVLRARRQLASLNA
jgi:hypothetical protein